MSKYWLETYGCQMNKAESYALENQLKLRGWTAADTEEQADMVIINTCSVRQTAENRIWGRLGYFKHLKESRPFRLILMGCMAQNVQSEIKKRFPVVDHVVGSFGKLDFLSELDGEASKNDFLADKEYSFFTDHSCSGVKAFLPIMNGCNNFCTYCIVPYVRGREVSRSPGEIYQEIKHFEAQGVRELTLLGQNVNSYRYNGEEGSLNFPVLLREIIHRVEKIRWIRLMSSHPKDISPEVIELITSHSLFCNNLHLPVQHGSDPVLKRMNRRYTVEDYRNIVQKILEKNPEFTFSTDIMVGFPGETEEDFERLLAFVKEIRFHDAFTYYYNPRTGTKAAEYTDPVPEDIKHRRLSRLIEIQTQIGKERRLERLGRDEEVLVESVSRKNERELLARTGRNEMVVFPGNKDRIGQFVQVRLDSLSGQTFIAKEV